MVPSIPVMLRWGNNKGDTVTANGAGEPFARDVVIIGGCGHVGLPLGVAFAARGLAVTLYDINAAAVDLVNSGRLPFKEDGAEEKIATAVREGRLVATTDPASVRTAEHIVVVVGTPVDEHLNP